MTEAAAIAEPSSSVPASGPALHAVVSRGDPDAEQRAVERVVARSAIIGILVGMAVCAVIWIGLMALALAGDEGFGPMIWVGAVCGAFAGIFLGGWAGMLIGALRLEHHEHETLRDRNGALR